jgi:hypothetical protein
VLPYLSSDPLAGVWIENICIQLAAIALRQVLAPSNNESLNQTTLEQDLPVICPVISCRSGTQSAQ